MEINAPRFLRIDGDGDAIRRRGEERRGEGRRGELQRRGEERHTGKAGRAGKQSENEEKKAKATREVVDVRTTSQACCMKPSHGAVEFVAGKVQTASMQRLAMVPLER
eukprot:764866-Hanusia_phi.AAC.2